MKILRALMIHGVGEQTSDFASEARHNLRTALAKKGWQLHCVSVHWAPLADKAEQKFLKAAELKGSRGNMSQKLVIGTLSDALMYQSNPELQRQIFHIIDQQVWMLGEPVIIFAHSLGGLIATDYLRARPEMRNVRLVTFGCNIGLFTLGETFDCPKQLRKPNSWINMYAKSDMLGFPVSMDPALKHVHDVEVSVGRWWSGWTGLAHTKYWGTKALWRSKILGLLGI